MDRSVYRTRSNQLKCELDTHSSRVLVTLKEGKMETIEIETESAFR